MIYEDFTTELLKKEIEIAKILSPKEERELIRRAKSGDKKAMDELIRSNLRYILKLSYKYSNYVPISYLVSEGLNALKEAIKKFDLRKRVRLLTFATYYIENAMQKFITEQSHPIKITLDYREKLEKILKTIEEFKKVEKREPTIEELSEALNMKPENIRKILNQYRKAFSLDDVDEENDNRTREETFEDPSQLTLRENIDKEIRLEIAINLIKRALNEREYKIIAEYYGIGCERKTLDEIAKELNISKERVRQIKEEVIKKLRFMYSDKLRHIFYD
ncbi:MAG: sigma-70 family RNA polymerase sigma factor [candidate division WOR-3 bacterium]